jgi:hypothetical protein
MWNPFADGAQGAVEGLGKAVKDAVGAFKANPEKVLEFEKDMDVALIQFQSSVIASVNATMQAEAKSEHWMQWAWRPTIGFTFAGVLINNYIFLPYFAKFGAVALGVPAEVWTAMLVVLGAAAAGRSWEKASK